MTEHETPSLGAQRHLRRLARRRMPRLLGPLLLLLPKRRLVNQEVRPLRRIDDGSTRPRVSRKHHEPPGTLRADNSVRAHRPPVRQSHRLAPLQLPPQVPFRNTGRPRFVGIKPPGPFVFLERVPNGSAAMLRPEHVNVVPFPFPLSPFPQNGPRLYLLDLDLKRHAFHPELKRLREELLRALGPVQAHRLGARL